MSLRRNLFCWVGSNLPRTARSDGVLLLTQFVRAHGRLPRSPYRSDATFNDLIYDRLRRNNWTGLERSCVDKENVKHFVRSVCPRVTTPSTLATIRISDDPDLDEIETSLLKYGGRQMVAKPTHGSGVVLFLRQSPTREAIRRFVTAASQSYYHVSREGLYKDLDRKIIIEEDLSSDGSAPLDYKFFCARGRILFCQVDIDRFSSHRRFLVTKTFDPIDIRYKYEKPRTPPKRPSNFSEMVDVAQELSFPFQFVRVDLYSVGGAVVFGELTFAPEAGTGSLSDDTFGRVVLAQIRSANRHAKVPIDDAVSVQSPV